MRNFTAENTTGYTASQLVALNVECDECLTGLDGPARFDAFKAFEREVSRRAVSAALQTRFPGMIGKFEVI